MSAVHDLVADVIERARPVARATARCVHGPRTRYLCVDHPDAGPRCGQCIDDHRRTHHTLADTCDECGEGTTYVQELVVRFRGALIVGLRICTRCLYAATVDGRRLAP